MATVLVIHAHAPLRLSLVDQLRRHDHTAVGAVDLEQARGGRGVASMAYAAVVIGVERGGPCASAISQITRAWPTAAVIVVGQSSHLRDATEAVRQGAYDYVAASDLSSLGRVLRGALQANGGIGPVPPRLADVFDEPIVVDPLTCAVFAKADRAAVFNSTVLITGESGTGKEVLARRIHRQNRRRCGKFVPVNCGSLPEALVETELFGYKRGAFTGAGQSSRGLIEEAEGGVLFLDEIGDMPLSMQGRLMRFLDSGEVRAVGDTCVKHVDVRVLAATNRDLRTEIREKRFREDLFFRLSVVSLHAPPLRDRRADLPPLIAYHARRAAVRMGLPAKTVTEEAMTLLVAYPWPGNIRELQNALEEALVQETPAFITARDLPPHIAIGAAAAWPRAAAEGGDLRRELLVVLRRHNNNHAEAASALGISRTTLWRRLKQRPIRLQALPDSALAR